MFDESNEEQLLPILFDVPAEGRGEFMTTAQISDASLPMAISKKQCHSTAWGYCWGQLDTLPFVADLELL
jgi:hypothetical protein